MTFYQPEDHPDNFSDDDCRNMDSDHRNNPTDGSRESADDWLMKSLEKLRAVPEIDAGFAEGLSDRLDQEFAEVFSMKRGTLDVDTTLSNPSEDTLHLGGSDAIAAGEGNPAENRHATLPASSSRFSRRKGNRLPRWLGGAIAAAAVLGMFVFWTSQPSFSWADMIRALSNQPWVQADAGRSSSWFSDSQRIVARRNSDETTFENRRLGHVLRFQKQSAEIIQRELVSSERSIEHDLISLLARRAGAETDDAGHWNLVSQSSRQIDDESGKWIELTVKFERTNPASSDGVEKFTAVFLLDQDKRVPVRGQVTTNDSDSRTISFDYPEDGPADIYDLGIASTVPIVNSRLDNSDQRLVLAANIEDEVPETLENDPSPPQVPVPQDSPDTQPTELVDTEPELPPQMVATLVAPTNAVLAVSIPSRSSAMTGAIDSTLEDVWKSNEVSSGQAASDEEFLRRVYLDAIGRIPTIAEYERFFAKNKTTRRSELIDDLLDSREHALHMSGIWKRILVPDDETAILRLGGAAKLEKWLADAFLDNRPYDQMVHDLMLAEGRVNESGPLLFYAAAKMNPEELAARTARTFLGMRLECAECHDHPFDAWTQEDFWGLAAYFARISRPKGKIEMVSPVLRVRDADFGDVTLPDSEKVVLPKLPLGKETSPVDWQAVATSVESLLAERKNSLARKSGDDDPTRREALADWLTSPGNIYFARATVNRVWGHLFGKGLVNPVDDMGSHNQPLSPELLDQLSGYFVQTGFDLRELTRVLLNSQAYQLSSRTKQGFDPATLVSTNVKIDESQADCFARMQLKPLTAEQLYDCLLTATGRTNLNSVGVSGMEANPVDPFGNIDRFSDPTRTAFLAQFRTSSDKRTDYQSGIPQALTLMNGPMIFSATSDAPKGILRSLSAPFFSDQDKLERLFIATLTRKPTPEETERFLPLLSDKPDDTPTHEVLGDILWVLLNSTEFTMNH